MPEANVAQKAIEFYTIELSQLPDGAVFVSMMAITVDDEEPQLLSQEITNQRVGSIDEALAVIRSGMTGTESR